MLFSVLQLFALLIHLTTVTLTQCKGNRMRNEYETTAFRNQKKTLETLVMYLTTMLQSHLQTVIP